MILHLQKQDLIVCYSLGLVNKFETSHLLDIMAINLKEKYRNAEARTRRSKIF
jgi:hypothetical protein